MTGRRESPCTRTGLNESEKKEARVDTDEERDVDLLVTEGTGLVGEQEASNSAGNSTGGISTDNAPGPPDGLGGAEYADERRTKGLDWSSNSSACSTGVVNDERIIPNSAGGKKGCEALRECATLSGCEPGTRIVEWSMD
jgi:hypothetical protein